MESEIKITRLCSTSRLKLKPLKIVHVAHVVEITDLARLKTLVHINRKAFGRRPARATARGDGARRIHVDCLDVEGRRRERVVIPQRSRQIAHRVCRGVDLLALRIQGRVHKVTCLNNLHIKPISYSVN